MRFTIFIMTNLLKDHSVLDWKRYVVGNGISLNRLLLGSSSRLYFCNSIDTKLFSRNQVAGILKNIRPSLDERSARNEEFKKRLGEKLIIF